MRDVSFGNFGLLISFLLPGFATLWGISPYSQTIQKWISGSAAGNATVGGFLYVTLASVAVGMIISTLRWLTIDRVHAWTGLPRPQWDFRRLEERYRAFELMVESHYRFYLFHANSLIALIVVYVVGRLSSRYSFGWPDVVFSAIGVILFAGSRDTLTKYNQRVADLLGTRDQERNGDQRLWLAQLQKRKRKPSV